MCTHQHSLGIDSPQVDESPQRDKKGTGHRTERLQWGLVQRKRTCRRKMRRNCPRGFDFSLHIFAYFNHAGTQGTRKLQMGRSGRMDYWRYVITHSQARLSVLEVSTGTWAS